MRSNTFRPQASTDDTASTTGPAGAVSAKALKGVQLVDASGQDTTLEAELAGADVAIVVFLRHLG